MELQNVSVYTKTARILLSVMEIFWKLSVLPHNIFVWGEGGGAFIVYSEIRHNFVQDGGERLCQAHYLANLDQKSLTEIGRIPSQLVVVVMMMMTGF